MHAPAVTAPNRCPRCGAKLATIRTVQLAMIRHGGYGHDDERTVVACRCGYTRIARTQARNPRKVA